MLSTTVIVRDSSAHSVDSEKAEHVSGWETSVEFGVAAEKDKEEFKSALSLYVWF